MSRSGRKYRDPFNLDARRRRSHPINPEKRQLLEEITQQELDDDAHDWFMNEREEDMRKERD